MLNRLRLKDFKIHESIDVSFTNGLNVIFGDNYRGKTTLLHAFLYAMGGPGLIPGGAAWVDRRDEHGNKHKASVEAWFTIDGQQYHVERTASRCNLWLIEEGEERRIANSPAAVAQELADRLGFPVRRLEQLKYAEQGNMKALLTLGVGELNKIVEEVAGVEIVNTSLKGCSAIVSDCNSRLDVLGSLTVDVAPVKEQLESSLQESAALASSAAELESSLAIAVDNQADAKAAYQRAENDYNQTQMENTRAQEHNRQRDMLAQNIQHQQQSLNELRGELELLEQSRDSLGSAVDIQSKLQEAQGREASLQAAIRSHLQHKEALGAATRSAERALAAEGQALMALGKLNTEVCRNLGVEPDGEMTQQQLARELLEELRNQLRVVDLQQLAAAEAVAKTEVNRLQEALDGSFCPSCNRPFEQHNPDQLAEELAAAKQKVAGASTALANGRRDVANFTSLTSALERSLQDSENAEQEARRCSEAIDSMPPAPAMSEQEADEKLQQTQHEIADLRASLREVETVANRLLQIGGRISCQEDQLAENQKRLANMPEMKLREPVALQAFRAALDSANQHVSTLQAELSTVQGQRTLVSQRIQFAQAQIAEYEQKEGKIKEATQRRLAAKGLQEYLKENRDRFLADVWGGIMAQVSQFTSACTGGDILRVTRQEDAFHYDCGLAESMPVAGTASGAQKTFMGVGMQLALATMMDVGFNTLLLDEPNADLSAEKSLAFLSALKACGQQTIIISHSREDAALADNVIEI